MAEISVIVPVYNVEKYLNRCLETIVNQTFNDIEVVLVDDGSTDGSSGLCNWWANQDSRIIVIHKMNGGLSSARNEGLRHASGNYIGFVDSDDWISNDMYESLYNTIIEYNASIAVGNIVKTTAYNERTDTGDGKVTEYSQDEYAKLFFRINSNEPVLYTVNKLYKRDVALKMAFPEGLIDEDVEGFFLALLHSTSIVSIDKDIYYYWQNPDGISYKWFTHKQMDLLTVWRHVYEICAKQKTDWVQFAKLNYYRANMGLLIRLALNDSKEDKEYVDEEKQLVSELKKHKRELLTAPFPISRKILVILMCWNYRLARLGIRVAKKVLHNSLKF